MSPIRRHYPTIATLRARLYAWRRAAGVAAHSRSLQGLAAATAAMAHAFCGTRWQQPTSITQRLHTAVTDRPSRSFAYRISAVPSLPTLLPQPRHARRFVARILLSQRQHYTGGVRAGPRCGLRTGSARSPDFSAETQTTRKPRLTDPYSRAW